MGIVTLMRDTDYAYAVGRIRSNENRLLTNQDFEGLLLSESCERCAARLADKGWEAQTNESDMIKCELNKLWALIDEVAPDSAAFNYFKIPNDYHNLKAALKALLAQAEWEHLCLYPVTVSIDTIKEAVEKKSFNLLPEHMTATAEEAYDALVSWVDGQRCEMIIDAASFSAAITEAKKQGGLMLEIAELNAYRADVRVAVRCARMKKPRSFILPALAECDTITPQGLAEAAAQSEEAICDYIAQSDKEAADALRISLSDFEQLCAKRLEKRLETVKYEPLGQAPLISYICARMEEIRKVRIIFAGLRNNLSPEDIRELL